MIYTNPCIICHFQPRPGALMLYNVIAHTLWVFLSIPCFIRVYRSHGSFGEPMCRCGLFSQTAAMSIGINCIVSMDASVHLLWLLSYNDCYFSKYKIDFHITYNDIMIGSKYNWYVWGRVWHAILLNYEINIFYRQFI